MVAMSALYATRIRYFRLLVHLVGGDLTDDIERDGYSSDRCFHEVVDLVQSIYVTSLMLEASDQFKGSTAIILTQGRWFLEVRA
jgi:hypothetical protein